MKLWNKTICLVNSSRRSIVRPSWGLGLVMGLSLASLASSTLAAAPKNAAASAEDEYYRITTLPIPAGVVLEAGALQLLPDGRLATATRLGDIFLVEGAFGNDPAKVKFTQFASGLHEVLGLTWRDGWLYCTQRGEVTRMKDTNGDGRADVFETVSDFWGINGDYHEYAFGSKFDREGNIWVVLCLTGSFGSDNPYRGWCLRVGADGKTLPTTVGIRSPGGIGTNALGDMFYTDNQGPWNGACALKHLVPGEFVGHPGGVRWWNEHETELLGPRPEEPKSGGRMVAAAKQIAKLRLPAVYFPYPKMGQSASGIACDATAGKFGPFAKQLFVGDQTHSTVMRVALEKVNGRYQGACIMHRQGFGSGSLALEFGPDGSLFVQGTDRGWGARGGKPFALERLNWTGKTPFEIHEMHAKHNGFELTFTAPVDPASAAAIASYRMETYTYIYQSSYGSPEVDKTTPTISSAAVAADGRSVRLVVDGLQEGHVHELHLPGVKSADGRPLLHPAAFYTMNTVPAE